MKVVLKRPAKESNEGAPRDYTPWDESKYRVKFLSFEEIDDQYGGLFVEFQAVGGDYDGQERRVRVFPNSEAIRTLVELTGGDTEDDEVEVDFDVLVGKEANVYIIHRSKGENTYMNAKKFSAARKAK